MLLRNAAGVPCNGVGGMYATVLKRSKLEKSVYICKQCWYRLRTELTVNWCQPGYWLSRPEHQTPILIDLSVNIHLKDTSQVWFFFDSRRSCSIIAILIIYKWFLLSYNPSHHFISPSQYTPIQAQTPVPSSSPKTIHPYTHPSDHISHTQKAFLLKQGPPLS
jgi:hypothetical protein